MKGLLLFLFLFPLFCFSQQTVEICEDSKTFTYTTSMDMPGTIYWSVNGDAWGEGETINYSFSDVGVYVISAIGENSTGCASDPVEILVMVSSCDPLIYWVPNVFTPDGNEFNQVWGPIFTSGYSMDNFQLYVFNRWGNLLWQTFDPAATWDGNYAGNPVSDGVYTWMIQFDDDDTDKKYLVHGHVTIIR